MGLTGVEPATPRERARAENLAAALGTRVVAAFPRASEGVRLLVAPEGLALAFEDRARGKPARLDFADDLHRLPLARGHVFRRAFGTSNDVVDATAGFGHDALRALSFGCTVTAIERSPVVFALLEDAVARGRAGGGDLAIWLERLTLVRGEATEVLAARTFDLVYLDPMFTKPKSSAKSPKAMQLLQELFRGEAAPDEDESELFEAARRAARSRVVVKRALKGRNDGPKPAHVFAGQSVRYDVHSTR